MLDSLTPRARLAWLSLVRHDGDGGQGGSGNDGGAGDGGAGNGGAGNGGAGNDGGAGNGGAGGGNAEDKTLSQADVDRIVSERLARERQKFADYDDLKTKAAEFDKIQDSQKTELQREQEARQRAEAENAELKTSAERIRIDAALVAAAAAAKVVDPNDVVALLRADAEKFALVKVGEDGQIAGAADAVAKLLEAKPHLKAPAGGGNWDGGARDQQTTDFSKVDRAALEAEASRYGIRLRS